METGKRDGGIQAQTKEQEKKKAANHTNKPAAHAISTRDQKLQADKDKNQLKEAAMLAQINTELVEGVGRKVGMGANGA
ncbi:MAG: hypothetical protein Q9207_002185 [Kuettlingeria erythrocarpa]